MDKQQQNGAFAPIEKRLQALRSITTVDEARKAPMIRATPEELGPLLIAAGEAGRRFGQRVKVFAVETGGFYVLGWNIEPGDSVLGTNGEPTLLTAFVVGALAPTTAAAQKTRAVGACL